MSKYDKEFYKEKRIWSKVKDELLGCYLKPYFSKMLTGQNHVVYIDGFSGKGKFDDGSFGSPLIALKNFEESLDRFKKFGEPKKIFFYFIELRHHEDLKAIESV